MMKQLAAFVVVLLTLASCVPISFMLASRSISTISVGPSVDYRSERIIKQSHDILAFAEGLDAIVAEAGFELWNRRRSYNLAPRTGTTYTSDYRLKDKLYSGWGRCLIEIDARHVSVAFTVGESEPGKEDFPPIDEIRTLVSGITPKIKRYFSSAFPERAIQVSEVYWRE